MNDLCTTHTDDGLRTLAGIGHAEKQTTPDELAQNITSTLLIQRANMQIEAQSAAHEDDRISRLERFLTPEERIKVYLQRTPLDSKKAIRNFISSLQKVIQHHDTLIESLFLTRNADNKLIENQLYSSLVVNISNIDKSHRLKPQEVALIKSMFNYISMAVDFLTKSNLKWESRVNTEASDKDKDTTKRVLGSVQPINPAQEA